MLSYTEALEQILSIPFELKTESRALAGVCGRVLAAPVSAPWPMPRFDNSAMDGFAFRAGDTAAAPVTLRVVGESAAGNPFRGAVGPGEAIRISTGAKMPEGLDGIMPVEKTSLSDDGMDVTVEEPARGGMFLRRCGSDVPEGKELFPRGTVITPAVYAVLASYNIEMVEVFVPPKVAILTSGDEIKLVGEVLGEDQIIGSSLYYLEEELRRCHCEPRLFGIAPDDAAAFEAMMREAVEWGDIVVTTAGVSVGEHDVVRGAMEALGGEAYFWRVGVRPGKPMLVARYGDVPHFGFPGNPLSTFCNTEIFLKPFLRQAMSIHPAIAPWERIVLSESCARDRGRLFFVAGRTELADGRRAVRPLPGFSSSNLYNAALANCFLVLEAGAEPAARGEEVPVLHVREGL